MSGIFDQIINYSPPLIVSGTVNYDGTWNASTNTPTLNNPPAASTKGDYYVVSVAGTQFSLSFAVGDWIISNGTAWEKVDLTDAVSSVFGRTGAVVGVSTDYSAVGLTNTAIGASSPSTGAFTTVSATTPIAVASGGTGVTTSTGTTNVVLSNSPTLVTPNLGTPSAAILTSATGLPISTGVSGLGTGIATALAVNTGSTGAPALLGSAGAFTTITGTDLTLSGQLFLGSNSNQILNFATNNLQFGAGAVWNGSSWVATATSAENITLGSSGIQFRLNTGLTPTNTFSFTTRGTIDVNGFQGAIGATTASTGSFTTLSATSGIGLNNGNTFSFGGIGSDTYIVGSAATDFIEFVTGAAQRALINNTGLAVTGALSATGAISTTTTAASSIARTLSAGALIANGNLNAFGFTPSSIGLSAGYNYSGGDAETNVIFGASSSSQQMRFQRWDGTTLTNVLTLVGTGNVGIGNTAPTSLLALSTGSGAGSDATSTGTLQIRQASTGLGNGGGLEFHASTFGSGYGFKWSAIDSSGVHLVLGSRENSATWTERLRVNSTGLAVTGVISSGTYQDDPNTGTTDSVSINNAGWSFWSRNGFPSLFVRRRTSDGAIAQFYRDTTQVGSISVTTTATAYNTSSDARLKTNVRALTGSGAIIDALKPSVFDWKTGQKDSFGFIAQETFEVFPTAVTKGDDNPDVIEQQWAMDAGKFMPLAIAELQSLRARVASLESK